MKIPSSLKKHGCGRAVLAGFALLVCAPFSHAADDGMNAAWTSFNGERIGNAGPGGYARITRKVGEVVWDKETALPLEIVFTTDQRFTDGIIGQTWRFPLMESSARVLANHILRWETPGGGVFIFRPYNPYGEDTMTDSRGLWRADIEGDKVLITSLQNPSVRFVYEREKLREFSVGKPGEPTHQYSIGYTTSGLPETLIDVNANEAVAVLAYGSDGKTVEAISSQGNVYRLHYAQEIFPPVTGRQYLLAFLATPDGSKETFTYGMAETDKPRQVLRPDLTTFECPALPIGFMNAIIQGIKQSTRYEWCSHTGLMVRDNQGEYAVGNPADDTCARELLGIQENYAQDIARCGGEVPFYAVSYKKEGESNAVLLSYDARIGEINRQANGQDTRTYSRIIPGGFYTREEVRQKLNEEGQWEEVSHAYFDKEGRLARRDYPDGRVSTLRYEDDKNGQWKRTYINGALTKEERIGEPISKE